MILRASLGGDAVLAHTTDQANRARGHRIPFLDAQGKPLTRHHYSTVRRLIRTDKVGDSWFWFAADRKQTT